MDNLPRPVPSLRQKLVIFTEHRDTLNYLEGRITTLLGRKEAVVLIHGGMGREERTKAQEAFRHDPTVQVLVATDAAGEGINLQRAHLMVNYDLPWNPNRLEQRFGRIHRIGQTEVCHLWNLVADETREGDVYRTLLEKIEQARQALGGQVFDVLGKIQFDGKPLRDLLIAAIRYGEKPEVRARLFQQVTDAFDQSQIQDLLEERALAHDSMDASRVYRIREEMERAEARRLQPHYIESFFREAFQRLGGSLRQRESRRYEVTHVPAPLRQRDRQIGTGEPILPRYERIAFDKTLIAPTGQAPAAFVCPGHPLLDATIDLTLERHQGYRPGTVWWMNKTMVCRPAFSFIYTEHEIDILKERAWQERRESYTSPFPYQESEVAMIKLTFTPAIIDQLHDERTQHPHPRVRQRMEAVYLKALGFKHKEIGRIVRISPNTLTGIPLSCIKQVVLKPLNNATSTNPKATWTITKTCCARSSRKNHQPVSLKQPTASKP